MGSIVRHTQGRTRVLIVDDHTVVRIGLTELINRDSRFEVIGEAESCAKGLEMVYRFLPEMVIIDNELGDASGCGALVQMHSHFPNIAMVIYSSNQNHEFVDDAFKHHVSAYVLKSSPIEALLHAMQTVHDGMEYIDPNLSTYIPDRSNRQSAAKQSKSLLTDREQTILRKLAMGKANKEIANELFITERTVKFHVSAILKRLKVKNRTQAVTVATELRLLEESNADQRNSNPIPIITQAQNRRSNKHHHQDRRNSDSQTVNHFCHPLFDRRGGGDRRKQDRRPELYLQLANSD